jgi:hypothetical protein
MKKHLLLAWLGWVSAQAMDCTAVFNEPPDGVPPRGMPGGPLLGNGDVGVVIGGPAEAQQFYIGAEARKQTTPCVRKSGRRPTQLPSAKNC